MKNFSSGNKIANYAISQAITENLIKPSALTKDEIANIPRELFEIDTDIKDDISEKSMPSVSYWKSTCKSFLKKKSVITILVFMIIIMMFTFVQPFLPNQRDPNLINNDPNTGVQLINRAPDSEFYFGTNSIGQDLWSRLWAGTRTSLFIGLLVTLIRGIIGTIIGIVWGYVKKLDIFFTEIYNVISNIPSIIIFTLISYIMRPSMVSLIFSMCIVDWLYIAKLVRIQTIILREREYNVVSRCFQTSLYRILFKNLLPHIISVLALQLALTIPSVISGEVFLTYIGLGLPAETPSLGNLIEVSRTYIVSDRLRYQFVFPAVVLSMITIGFYIVGNSFADAADPKNQHK